MVVHESYRTFTGPKQGEEGYIWHAMVRKLIVSKTQPIRVALVFFGQPRFINLPYSFFSHKLALRNYSVDVFGHSWEHAGDVSPVSFWSGLGAVSIPADFKEILKRNYPKGVFAYDHPIVREIEPRLALDLMSQAGDDSLLQKRIRNFSNVHSQLMSQHKALELVVESGQLGSYDFIFLSRYDNVLIRVPNLKHLAKNKLYLARGLWTFVDMVAFGEPTKVLALDPLSKSKQLQIDIQSLTPEEQKGRSFLAQFSPNDVQYVPIASVLLRSSTHLGFALTLIIKSGSYLYSRAYSFYSKAIIRRSANN